MLNSLGIYRSSDIIRAADAARQADREREAQSPKPQADAPLIKYVSKLMRRADSADGPIPQRPTLHKRRTTSEIPQLPGPSDTVGATRVAALEAVCTQRNLSIMQDALLSYAAHPGHQNSDVKTEVALLAKLIAHLQHPPADKKPVKD